MFRLGKLSAAVISANAAIVTTLAIKQWPPQEIRSHCYHASVQSRSRRACFDTGDERKFLQNRTLRALSITLSATQR